MMTSFVQCWYFVFIYNLPESPLQSLPWRAFRGMKGDDEFFEIDVAIAVCIE